jgi:putative DNA primase/helicase
MDPPPRAMKREISQRHLDELRASGLNDETLAAAKIYSALGGEVAKILGWQLRAGNWGTALVIPYIQPDGSDFDYARVKLDFPRCSSDNKPIKYESPRRQQSKPYFPPGFTDRFKSMQVILITEGEKKALAAAQAGYCCIGLGGVWNFQKKRLRDDRSKVFGKRHLAPELASLEWRDKTVVIAFDSDVSDRTDLQLAECRLAELLALKGCLIRVLRLPQVTENKTGLDDYLVYHGAKGNEELDSLISTAQEPELPDATNAMDIAKILIEDSFTCVTGLRLRYWREDFWYFHGKKYQVIPQKEMVPRVLKWIDENGFKPAPKLAAEVCECLKSLSLLPFSIAMPAWLDEEDHGDGWMSFDNGLFRISHAPTVREATSIVSTGHSARYFCSSTLSYQFDPTANCPMWMEFLNRTLDGDPQRIDCLQRWFGLLLTPDTSHQKALLLVGPPRAGKGTICRVLGKIIGPDHYCSPILSNFGTQFGLAALLNKTVAIIPDAHIGKNADGIRITEMLKSIIGEDGQDINRKYKDQLDAVRLKVRFVISCNELAHFTDPSGALGIRFSIIPFYNSYVNQEDLKLEQKLNTELPGICNWGITGLVRLYNEGRLNVPEKSQALHDNFKRLSSPSAAYSEECLEFHPTFSSPTLEIYASWIGWCKANGHEPGSDARLGERLRSINPSIERTRPRQQGGSRPYYYQGIRLTPIGIEYANEGRHHHSGKK